MTPPARASRADRHVPLPHDKQLRTSITVLLHSQLDMGELTANQSHGLLQETARSLTLRLV